MEAITFALVVIMCLMAFTVNYTKAFRVKNEIRNIIEKNDGLTANAELEIAEFIHNTNYYLPEEYEQACKQMGYDVYTGNSADGASGIRFCIKCNYANATGWTNEKAEVRGVYYSIATFVTFDIPVVNNIFPISASFFRISGETQLIYSENYKYSRWCQ